VWQYDWSEEVWQYDWSEEVWQYDGSEDVCLHVLTSSLDGCEQSIHEPLGERVRPRVVLDTVQKRTAYVSSGSRTLNSYQTVYLSFIHSHISSEDENKLAV